MNKLKMAVHILLFSSVSSLAFSQDCPPVPDLPQLSAVDLSFQQSWKSVAEPYSIRDTTQDPDDSPLGIGYLQVDNAHDIAADFYYDWSRHISLPLWGAPDEEAFYGWILGGQVHAGSLAPFALGGAGMVETDYEQSSLIVWETHGGWLRISLLPDSTAAWTHKCHLAVGKAKLRYASWESFLREHGDWLHFRAQVPHLLRTRPDRNSERVVTIGLDHKLTLLEVSGDWMRVKVQQPDLTCSGEPEVTSKGSQHQGWIKWRDDIKGPWVWVYARGC